MSNVLLFRKVADGLDVALPATQDPPQCMHIGVSGGRMTKHAVEGYTQIALQEQLGAIGFELLGERAFDEASVVETVPSDVLFVVLGVNESAFRKSVAGLVGGEPDWSFVDHHEEMFVVGTGNDQQRGGASEGRKAEQRKQYHAGNGRQEATPVVGSSDDDYGGKNF